MNYKIKVNNQIVDVTEEVYYAYYHMANREEYLEKRDKKNELIHYHALDIDGMTGESIVEDYNSDILKNILAKEEKERLYQVIAELDIRDREIIIAIYFSNQTEKEVAETLGVSRQAVHKKKVRILNELKNILKN